EKANNIKKLSEEYTNELNKNVDDKDLKEHIDKLNKLKEKLESTKKELDELINNFDILNYGKLQGQNCVQFKKGSYTLTLKNKLKLSDRWIVFLSSHTDTTKPIDIWYYSSKSQGGTWRYCYYTNMYQKGKNYTATTMVDFHIQTFINNNFDIIPTTTIDNQIGVTYCNNERDFMNYADSNERHIENNVFEPLKLLDSAKSLRGLESLEQYITKFKKNEFFNKMLEIIHKERDRQKSIPQSIHKTLFIYVTSFNTYLENYFELVKNSEEFIGTSKFNVNESFFDFMYKKVTIKRKGTNDKYDIYFGEYIYKNIINEQFNGKYNIPLLITVADTSINRLGLYQLIVDAGAYLYKPLDYIDQCDKSFNCQERNINNEYIFIGDINNNKWPLNLL
ncbi:MAG: hypothetical protein MUO21_02325, partial [Nitrososphaeraceae archaeon]|nr:hypothetical protein [Nitrososphaeraceae archaeon]